MGTRQLAAPLHFVFEGVGTRGDVAPLLAIAESVSRHGHSVHVLANDVFEPDARARGLAFTPTTGASTTLYAERRKDPANYLLVGFEATRAYFASGVPPQTIVVNIDRLSASSPCAERHGLRSMRLHLSPYKIRSLVAPPWPFRAHTSGRSGELYRRYALPRFFAACDTDPRILSRVNDCRSRLGLAEVNRASHPEPLLTAELCLFPEWFCPPASDWPCGAELTGFPLLPPRGVLPPALSMFIAEHGPPLVFTPGTGISDVDAFFGAALECCAALDRPGVMLSPHLRAAQLLAAASQRHPGLESRLFIAGYVELSELLPRSALLVHHGGIGTLAEALRAGVPQVIRPLGFDQPDNAERVARLGVGVRIDREHFCPETLCAAARQLLGSADVQRRVREVQSDVSKTEALAHVTARLLEHARA